MSQSKCCLTGNLLKLTLLVSIPVLLALVLGSDAILPAFTYLGLLITWVEIELKLRALAQGSFETSLLLEPFFEVGLQAAEPAEDRHCATRLMYIRNVSSNQAYHVRVGRIRDAKNRIVCLNEKESFLQSSIASIAPGEEVCLLSLDESVIQQGPTVEMSYFS
nr:hypothetical protein [Candidatus Njordarchaeota archaeon]